MHILKRKPYTAYHAVKEKQSMKKWMQGIALVYVLLLLGICVPSSMLVQALYNIVDSMFVAQINENALTAVSLAFPTRVICIKIPMERMQMIVRYCVP